MLKKYKEVSNEIEALHVPKKTKAICLVFSIVLALVLVSGPLCICINLLIFRDVQKLLAFAIATILIFAIFAIHYVYLKCITNHQVKNLNVLILTDTLLMAILVYLVLIVIYFTGVI